MKLFYEIFSKCKQQGPGSKKATVKAFTLTGLSDKNISLLDVGCGTGRQTLDLAQMGISKITAIDNSELFISILNNAIKRKGNKTISAQKASMFNIPFNKNTFDLIWSEGAIYIIGFKKGLQRWKKYLKKNGIIVVSEISYIRKDIPKKLEEYWNENYPEIGTVSEKISITENCGYSFIASFTLPEDDWIKKYYIPFFEVINTYKKKYTNNQEVLNIENEMKMEYEFYCKYKKYYSYVFYILQKH